MRIPTGYKSFPQPAYFRNQIYELKTALRLGLVITVHPTNKIYSWNDKIITKQIANTTPTTSTPLTTRRCRRRLIRHVSVFRAGGKLSCKWDPGRRDRRSYENHLHRPEWKGEGFLFGAWIRGDFVHVLSPIPPASWERQHCALGDQGNGLERQKTIIPWYFASSSRGDIKFLQWRPPQSRAVL